MTRIALVVGSLRKGSYNRQLATYIAAALERHCEVVWLEYADLPAMNQDVEWPPPAPVARVRGEVESADGMWFVCPEYNGSYPGHVKGLVDWLSRPSDPASSESRASAITGKRVTISGVAGRSGANRMRGKLTELLEMVGAEVMDGPFVGKALGPEDFAVAELKLSSADASAIDEQVDAFYAFVAGTPASPTVHDSTSVPAEPSEGGVFARSDEVGGCSSQGCSVHDRQ